MQGDVPLTRDLVLVGGGHAHALVMLKWAMRPLPGVRLTLINPEPATPYTGMLPGHVAGHYPREALNIDLVRLARHCGARLVPGRATGLDRVEKRIKVPGRPDVAYDIASLDIGITSSMPDIPGFADFAHAAKPLGPFAAAWETFVHDTLRGKRRARIAVIGAGVGGVELSLAMAHRLRAAGLADVHITILERAPSALPDVGTQARTALTARLARTGISLRTNSRVSEIGEEGAVISGGGRVEADFVVGAAGARPHSWLTGTGLELHDGFVTVGRDLKSVTDPSIYAVGDCAHLSFTPRPKAGVFAVRQAPVLYHNLRADLSGAKTTGYRPQKDYLKLVSLGSKTAIADKFGMAVRGSWVWSLKDWIDRRFMDKFARLKPMKPPAVPRAVARGVREELADGKPLCGGCGAKVGQEPLASALQALPAPRREDVALGRGDDAAIMVTGGVRQVFTTDHLRAFVEDPWLFTRIAANHALGDIWAMGAEPQAGLLSVTLPRMTGRMQRETLREIVAGAGQVFAAAGADIVGGHTSLGSELSVGFSVTGLIEGTPLSIDGAEAGDVLILTKPVGVGVLLAAEMEKRARGEWVIAAYESMLEPQGQASAILAESAHAMTDVTGFGLAGHLLAMLDAAGVAATLDLEAVPVLEGARELSRQGVRSSLWRSNAAVADRVRGPGDESADLLFDPQTGGGLLAALPPGAAARALERFVSLGSPAAIIGEITAGPPSIFVSQAG
ncbi:MAG: selenide, water dikinase SelD [Alphaproteobacteria bacterium]